MASKTSLIDFSEPLFIKAAILIIAAPTIWNIVARAEYYTHFLRKLTSSRYVACYIIALWVFGFSTYRDLV